jgi:integrase/recombinase XerC
VRVADDLYEALKQYVPLRLQYAEPGEENPLLLVSRIGGKPENPVLSRPVVWDIVEGWRLKAGIRHFKYHCLRHTFATRLLSDGGGNIRTVQLLLRHRHITSTMIYTHPGQDDLDLAVMKAFNSGAQTVPAKL